MSEWISVDDKLPEVGEFVLVFRPQVITDDHTDKPIRTAVYKEQGFDCYHKPTMWARIEKPKYWDLALDNRQQG